MVKYERLKIDKDMEYTIRKIKAEDNVAIAKLIRENLKSHNLDIPGTVYYDPELDTLYDMYSGGEERGYFVLVDSNDCVVGGIGYDKFPPFKNCAELQKLYLADEVKGRGMGYMLIRFIEERMREAGYGASYLETHENLEAALHIYCKSGYEIIERPKEVAHGAMTHFFYKKLH